MNNTYKVFVWAGLIVVAVVVLAAALFNTSKTNEQKQQAVATTNDLIGGKPMPAVTIKDKDGNVFDMASLKGKNAVLFFNEGLMCYPACWNQMAAFGTDPRFNSNDVVAISVVTDTPQQWQKAYEKMPDLARATTLFDNAAGVGESMNGMHPDPKNTASYRLGILSMPSSMHPGQSPGHTYILIDKQGIVRDVYDDANMGVNNDMLMEKINKF